MMNLLNEYELAIGQFPAQPQPNQVIYVESKRNPRLEEYIIKNYKTLQTIFACRGLEFVYVPMLPGQMSDEDFEKSALYYLPWLKKEDLDKLRGACKVETEDIFREIQLLDDMPAMVNDKGRAFKIDVSRPVLFDIQFRQIASAYGKAAAPAPAKKNSRFLRRKLEELMDNSEDFFSGRNVAEQEIPTLETSDPDIELFSPEPVQCCYETASDFELDRLYNQALNTLPAWAIKEALQKLLQDQEVISRLVITEQGKLFLPDYNNIEIKLTPKEKAIYFLFLKHPEGICFKDLPDFRNELGMYYRRVAKSDDPEAIHATIGMMVDILSGDPDIQRSRIKAKFNEKFTDRFCQQYARYYTIEGTRGQALKVELPREKVIWELDI